MTNLIKNFVSFLRKQKCVIPEKFLTDYYIITKESFIAITDCILWLGIQRDGIIKTLRSTYKKNIDYFEITKQEEYDLIKLNHKIKNIKTQYNQKYYKISTDSFKKIAMSSHTAVGKMTKEYYIEMERIVKDFSNQEILRLQNENKKLKRNLNPIKLADINGLYVWHENDQLTYRIGSAENLKRRIKQHNSSHADNIIVDYHIETNCYKDLEANVLKVLDTKRYRNNKDFFDCDFKIIKKVIIKANKLLIDFRDNCV